MGPAASDSRVGPTCSGCFLTKLGVLIPLALVLHIVNQRKVQERGLHPEPPLAAKVSGATELLLWLCVVTAAVLIPYAG